MVRRFLLLRGRSTVGDSLRVRPRLANILPSISGYVALAACALSIAGGYACWGYGMLHGNHGYAGGGSYATPVFSTASNLVLLGVALGVPFWIGVVL